MIVIVLHIPMHRVVMFCNTYLTYIMLGFAGANALLESKADIVQLMCWKFIRAMWYKSVHVYSTVARICDAHAHERMEQNTLRGD